MIVLQDGVFPVTGPFMHCPVRDSVSAGLTVYKVTQYPAIQPAPDFLRPLCTPHCLNRPPVVATQPFSTQIALFIKHNMD